MKEPRISRIITNLGQYYHRDSPVHRLDPRAKLLSFVFIVTSALIVRNPFGFLAIAFFLVIAIVLSHLPLILIMNGLRKMLWLFISILVLQAFFSNTGVKVIFSAGPAKVTWEGILSGLIIGCRFMLIVLGANLLTLTTMPLRLADGLTALLYPFKRLGIPVHQIPIMMVVILQFIPTLFIEAEKIATIHRLRGAKTGMGNIFNRLKLLIPLTIPLLKSAFRQADALAMGMESRCYHGQDRAGLYEMSLKKNDVLALSLAVSISLFAFLIDM